MVDNDEVSMPTEDPNPDEGRPSKPKRKVSRATRVWMMIGAGFVLGIPAGGLMSLFPKNSLGENLMAWLWVAATVVACIWINRSVEVPPKAAKVRRSSVRGVQAPSGDWVPAKMWRYTSVLAPGAHEVEIRRDYVPGRMRDQVSAFVFLNGELVGGCTPDWLARYESRLPLVGVLVVEDDETTVLFPA